MVGAPFREFAKETNLNHLRALALVACADVGLTRSAALAVKVL